MKEQWLTLAVSAGVMTALSRLRKLTVSFVSLGMGGLKAMSR